MRFGFAKALGSQGGQRKPGGAFARNRMRAAHMGRLHTVEKKNGKHGLEEDFRPMGAKSDKVGMIGGSNG